jgi:3D (Asp-Asp-Asp) domain-containing protein
MKHMHKMILILGAMMIFSSCSTLANPKNEVTENKKGDTIRARVTFYHPCKRWGSKVASPKVKYAKEGVTVAASKKIPFGTKVVIPELEGIVGDGNFVVQDRGSAVDSKRASKGKAPVIDVFVSSASKVNRYKTLVPDYLEIQILN